jgi:hypothetical protein
MPMPFGIIIDALDSTSLRFSVFDFKQIDDEPVCRLKISEELSACLDEYPKLIPIPVLSLHFLIFLWSCRSFLSTNLFHYFIEKILSVGTHP